jgi:nicotinamide mononucleotide adenylyltransferase
MKNKTAQIIKKTQEIKEKTKVYKMLHGDHFNYEDVLNDISTEDNIFSRKDTINLINHFIEDVNESERIVVRQKKFGLVIMRAQPFHKGHQEIINEILLAGLTPVIVLGSSNDDRDRLKNPLTYAQRKELIRLVYPNVPIIFIRGIDYESWDLWYENLMKEIFNTLHKEIDYNGTLEDDIVLFSHNKEVDRTTFIFHNKEHKNTFYTDIFEEQGFVLRQIQFVKRTDVKIDANARDIRDNIEGMKHLLDARAYFKLKEWLW